MLKTKYNLENIVLYLLFNYLRDIYKIFQMFSLFHFWDKIFLFSLVWPPTHCVAQSDLEFELLLTHSQKSWDYTHLIPYILWNNSSLITLLQYFVIFLTTEKFKDIILFFLVYWSKSWFYYWEHCIFPLWLQVYVNIKNDQFWRTLSNFRQCLY